MPLDIRLVDQSSKNGFDISLKNPNEQDIEIINISPISQNTTTKIVVISCNQLNALKSKFKCFKKLNCCKHKKNNCPCCRFRR